MNACISFEVHGEKFSGALCKTQAPLVASSSIPVQHLAMLNTRRRKGKDEREPWQIEDRDRLIALWKRRPPKLTQVKIANLLDCHPSLISQYFSGESALTWRAVMVFAQELGIQTSAISPTLTADNSLPKSLRLPSPSLVGGYSDSELIDLGPSLAYRMVPVVGMAQLGDNGFYEELGFPPGDGDGFIQVATKDPNAYALKVRGNSMHPAIRDGWIVMVEPNSEPQVGEFAVVQCANGRKMVKEFLGWRGDELILQSVNEDHGRLTLHRSEVKAIHAVGGIHPPSKREMR